MAQARKIPTIVFRPQPSTENVPSLETVYVEEKDTDMNKCGGSGCGALSGVDVKGWAPGQ